MLYANFWHLKYRNGMFYYGTEYLYAISEDVSVTIIVRKGALNKKDFDENYNVIEASLITYLSLLLYLIYTKSRVFCPTTHGIPFLKKQITIFHDPYPFNKNKFFLKYFYLNIMYKFYKGRVGVINKSAAKKFVEDIKKGHTFYSPNLINNTNHFKANKFVLNSSNIRIGLVGTDSKKKNYEDLFFSASKISLDIEFVMYGTNTPYLNELLKNFNSKLKISFISSDQVNLDDFIKNYVDVIASVSEDEGFCRPIALAGLLGVNTFLINSPVFREFYSEISNFGYNPRELLFMIVNRKIWKNPKMIKTNSNILVSSLNKDFIKAVNSCKLFLELKS